MFYIFFQVSVILTVATATVPLQTIILNDGNKIPVICFGTFGRVIDVDVIKPAVIDAIESGYRHIDTAALYKNEEQVGEAVADVINRGIVTREDLFITTKIDFNQGTREAVLPALQESLRKFKLDYVDLYLIHSPLNAANISSHDYLSIWKGMEDVKKLNLTRSIGVSNFETYHLDRILANSETVPAVNQIEVHPFFKNINIVEYCLSLNITVLSYGPLGFMVPRLWLETQPKQSFKEPILAQLAQKYGKLPSQIVLRYLLDRKTLPISKSTNKKHIKSNIDIFDFQLTPEEINSINQLREDAKVYSFDPALLSVFMEYHGLN